MQVLHPKGLLERAPLLYQTWAGRTKGRNCLQCLWSCLKGRKLIYKALIFKVLLFKWYYTVGRLCSPKKRHEKWLETLYIPMMLSKTSQTLLQGLCPLFMNVFNGGYAVFLSLCLSLSGFSLQWTWAREMSFLVNAVSCLRKWSRMHPIKLFLSF